MFKGQGKPRPRFRPGGRNQLDPVDRTVDPRHPGMEKRLALTGIQVSPDPLLVVVMQGTALSTGRAFPLKPFELLYPYVHSVFRQIQFHFNHPSGMPNPQQSGIQSLGVFHDDLQNSILQEIKTIQFSRFCLWLWLTFVVYSAPRSGQVHKPLYVVVTHPEG